MTPSSFFLASQPHNFHVFQIQFPNVCKFSFSKFGSKGLFLPESCPVATGITLYGDLEESERVHVSNTQNAVCISYLTANRVGWDEMFYIKHLKAVFFPQIITPALITTKNLQNQEALVL